MNAEELNARLLAVGEKVKAKGWKSASIDLGISYLAIFDIEPGRLDPMIHYSPCIRTTVHHSDSNGDFERPSQHYGARSFDIKNIDAAVAALEALAEEMPSMADESARIKAARAKLSDEEKRLLGLR